MYQRPPNGARRLHHVALKPSSHEDDVSSSANHLQTVLKFFRPSQNALHLYSPKTMYRRLRTTLQLPEPFQFAMALPGFDTTYRRPLNAVSTCGSR
ncbi:hypothetical protein K443DRAFT_13733 [Laccaria amethystina LaAM-08-1]|uniref:Uncharacterized protein n=1 Tax=Laccaria amethystina LaAM-08-1 TaxID=1095629 RepID=A0A0C9WNT8_9AGAR|nr:hypothetical protein K443DRAFT_13733 [Laccaria amethystina LaAM-08-1]